MESYNLNDFEQGKLKGKSGKYKIIVFRSLWTEKSSVSELEKIDIHYYRSLRMCRCQRKK